MGITNCLANFSGVLAPYVVGLILQDPKSSILDLWSTVFYISCYIYVVTSIIFVIFGSAELQVWNHYECHSVLDKDNKLSIRLDVCEPICDQISTKTITEATKLK